MKTINDDIISRKAAIKTATNAYVVSGDGTKEEYRDLMVDCLKELPSAQPEIIRCKDCKWCEERYDSIDRTPYWRCQNWDGETDADGFCHEADLLLA